MQQYLDLMQRIMDEGEDVQSGAVLQSENRKPTCRFLLAAQLRFDLRDGFPAVTTKKLLFDWVVDEVLWFLRGETSVKTLGRPIPATDGQLGGFLKRPIWDQWAGPDGDVPHIYGENWRRWPYPDPDHADQGNPALLRWDQVADVLDGLKGVVADPSDRRRRRLILTGWNPPMVPRMGLAPCHTLAQFLPTNGFLDVVCHWRSIDTFTGMPFNICQYALLAHILGRIAGLEPRHLVCNVADCHLYDNQFAQAREQVAREPLPAPTLEIDRLFFETAPNLRRSELLTVDPSWFRLRGYRHHKGALKAEVAV